MKKKKRNCLLKRETLIHWDQYDTSMEFYLYLAVSKEIIENLKNFKGMSEEYILIPGETEDGAFEFFWTEREYEGFLENLTSIYRPQVKFIKSQDTSQYEQMYIRRSHFYSQGKGRTILSLIANLGIEARKVVSPKET